MKETNKNDNKKQLFETSAMLKFTFNFYPLIDFFK